MDIKNSNFIITIDGTAGSGKSTISKIIATKYNLKFLPTGIFYRKLAKLVKENITDIRDIQVIKSLLIQINNASEEDLLDQSLYEDRISSIASKLAQLKEVREYFFLLQRKFVEDNKRVILEGRDTGTIIAPEANLKFFLTADPVIRAKRRTLQNESQNFEEMKNSLSKRDQEDALRDIAPLQKPQDAIEIDSTNLSIEQVINIISNHIDKVR